MHACYRFSLDKSFGSFKVVEEINAGIVNWNANTFGPQNSNIKLLKLQNV